jgi:hypothetical protein
MPASTLPVFTVTPLPVEFLGFIPGTLIEVVCPRKTCDKAFYIASDWLQMTDHVVGRPCPWCHRWAEVPEEYRRRPVREDDNPTRRRTVRRRKSKRSK